MKKGTFFRILILLAVSFIMTACSSTNLVDGVYEGSGKGMYGDIVLAIEVSDGTITSIDIISHSESESITDKAFDEIPKSIIEKQSTEVDTVSGATITSNGIIEAVNEALEKAK